MLASRNDEVVKATSWLNERGVPFISYSSLDVRRRKTAGEMLALLTFLDSPKDDLSFVTFILGEIFRTALDDAAGSPGRPGLHPVSSWRAGTGGHCTRRSSRSFPRRGKGSSPGSFAPRATCPSTTS